MKTQNVSIYMLAMSLLTLSTPLLAQIYKWTDAQNEVHYSENPPADVNASPVSTHTQPSSSAEQERKRFDKIEAQFSKTKAQELKDKEKAQQDAATAKLKQANCEQARAQLATMQSKARLKMTDTKGNTTMLTQEQRDAEIAKTQEIIKQNCGGT